MVGFVGSSVVLGRSNWVDGGSCCDVRRMVSSGVVLRRSVRRMGGVVSMCEEGDGGKTVTKAEPSKDMREKLVILQDPVINRFFMNEGTKEPRRTRELNLREKELLFLDALYSYGSEEDDLVLTDEQFDLLKEDLTWEGSRVMLLNDQEKKFLEAARAYYKGQPIMSDDEFDAMREALRLQGSSIAVSRGPKCSLETMVCVTDCTPDNERMFITQLPAAGIAALVWAAITFEVTPLRSVPHIYTLIGGIPFIAILGRVILTTKTFGSFRSPPPTTLTPFLSTVLPYSLGDALNLRLCFYLVDFDKSGPWKPRIDRSR